MKTTNLKFEHRVLPLPEPLPVSDGVEVVGMGHLRGLLLAHRREKVELEAEVCNLNLHRMTKSIGRCIRIRGVMIPALDPDPPIRSGFSAFGDLRIAHLLSGEQLHAECVRVEGQALGGVGDPESDLADDGRLGKQRLKSLATPNHPFFTGE